MATDEGEHAVRYEQLVVALGSVVRVLPVPGLAEHGLGFKSLPDAIALRNHVLRRLEAADAALDDETRGRELGFVFVGAGYAGVEALAELFDLVQDALRFYPRLRDAKQRWVLVDAAPTILHEIPSRLGEYAARQLVGAGSRSASPRRSPPWTRRRRRSPTASGSRPRRSCGRPG